jgi:RNA polymerase sigma factor (TIGR02999 family)
MVLGDGDLVQLIERAQAGERAALDELFAVTYADLHGLARARLRAAPRVTVLDTVALVNESYMRLIGAGRLRPQDRSHFVRYAARAMRSVIVDFVRRRATERRGGDLDRVQLTTGVSGTLPDGETEILKVHEALEGLAALDARAAEVVEMRYFSGMSEPEIANALGVTERTVRRDWAKARLLLAEALDL